MFDAPSVEQKRVIEAAVAAIGHCRRGDGRPDPREQQPDPATHLKCLPEASKSACATLRSILSTDKTVLKRGEEYTALDAAAVMAKRWYKWPLTASIALTALLMFIAVALHLTPLESSHVVKPLTYLAGGLALASVAVAMLTSFLGILQRRLLPRSIAAGSSGGSLREQARRDRRRLIWSALAIVVATPLAAWGLNRWDPLAFAFAHPTFLSLAVVALLGLALLLVDVISGGHAARMLGVPSLKERFYERRGLAESVRREYFKAVLIAAIGRSRSVDQTARTPDELPIASQVLEYIRRFYIEPQRDVFDNLAKRNAEENGRGRHQQRLFLAGVTTLMIALVVSLLIAESEQPEAARHLPAILPDELSAVLLQHGGEVSTGLTLLALSLIAIALFLRSRSAVEEFARHAVRYRHAHANLTFVTSQEPEKARFPSSDAAWPLDRARIAAEQDHWDPVQQLCSEVSVVLARELNAWSGAMTFAIDLAPGTAAPRLVSAEKLTPNDFRTICDHLREYGYTCERARKIGFAAAKQATAPTVVHTIYNQKETVNEAKPGDWIVVNMEGSFSRFQPGVHKVDNYLIIDAAGNKDTYVIAAARFPELYEETEHTSKEGLVYRSKSTVDAVKVPGGFDILAPWGERQRRDAGYIVCNGREEVYGILDEVFERTYLIVTF